MQTNVYSIYPKLLNPTSKFGTLCKMWIKHKTEILFNRLSVEFIQTQDNNNLLYFKFWMKCLQHVSKRFGHEQEKILTTQEQHSTVRRLIGSDDITAIAYQSLRSWRAQLLISRREVKISACKGQGWKLTLMLVTFSFSGRTAFKTVFFIAL